MRSLANQMRPATFGSAIGEAARINGGILRNQVKTGKTAHAYLFDGLRGSGKTTTARTLAKALNCLDLKDGEPCGCCEACRRIEEGSATDVKEVDAARNNGVDYARALEEDAGYQPIELRKKVYILDECHCLSADAFSSLLKLIEQPPEWCVFIFCTTDPQKMPVTIRSRCQEFRFKAVSKKEMAEHLLRIAEEYGASLTPAAADTIARHSEGSVRDAVMALETCLGEESRITEERVNEILGSEAWQQVFLLLDALMDGKRRFIINCVDRWFDEGRKITDVLSDCITAVTDRLRFLAGAEPDGTEDYVALVKETRMTECRAFALADGLRETLEKMRYTPDRGILTVSLLKVSAAREEASFTNETEILGRLSDAEKLISALSEKVKELEAGKSVSPAAAPAVMTATAQKVQYKTVDLPSMDSIFGLGGDSFAEPMQNMPQAETGTDEIPFGVPAGTGEESVEEAEKTVADSVTGNDEEVIEELAEVDLCGSDAELPEWAGGLPDDGFIPTADDDIPSVFLEADGCVDDGASKETVVSEAPEMPVKASEEKSGTNVEPEALKPSEGASKARGKTFGSLDELFACLDSQPETDEKSEIDKKLEEDPLFKRMVSYCDREERNGKVTFRTSEAVVADSLKIKLEELGLSKVAKVVLS